VWVAGFLPGVVGVVFERAAAFFASPSIFSAITKYFRGRWIYVAD
jgi:hypothetical protein